MSKANEALLSYSQMAEASGASQVMTPNGDGGTLIVHTFNVKEQKPVAKMRIHTFTDTDTGRLLVRAYWLGFREERISKRDIQAYIEICANEDASFYV